MFRFRDGFIIKTSVVVIDRVRVGLRLRLRVMVRVKLRIRDVVRN